MKISFLDAFLSSISLILILVFSFLATFFLVKLLVKFVAIPIEFSGIVKVLLFVLAVMVWSGLGMKLVRMVSSLKEGTFLLSKDKETIAWKLQGFLYIFNLGLVMNTYLVPVNLRSLIYSFLGAKIGRNVMIGGKILEPPLVEIGNFSMLGEDTLITAHSVEGDKVELGKVKIGNHVTIGVKAVVLPGVEIGDHAVVAAGAVVQKGRRIPPEEIWGGIPAKKIGKVKHT